MTVNSVINLNYFTGTHVLDPVSKAPIGQSRLAEVFPPSLAEIELSKDREFAVPEELRDALSDFRPTPVFEAKEFAGAIGGGSRVFIKDEGATPSSNHKMNSALWIAYHCARDDVRTVTTETTGNWGIALALAAQRFGIEVICYIDEHSVRARPDRSELMTKAGARVVVVKDEDADGDPLVLSADRAVRATRDLEGARYIFGSVYNYFIAPQTVSGIEAREQLADLPPDLVVGSCGGGANLLGIASAFLAQRIEQGSGPEVLCAESELCPIVSEGVPGQYSIDQHGYYPLLETYGLPRLLGSDYIGGLGSTIVAAPVAEFHRTGLIKTMTFSADDARGAAALFEQTEGRRVALETGYQLAAVARAAREGAAGRILVNISTVDRSSYA